MASGKKQRGWVSAGGVVGRRAVLDSANCVERQWCCRNNFVSATRLWATCAAVAAPRPSNGPTGYGVSSPIVAAAALLRRRLTKAAAISSAMLARKSSYQKGRESQGLLDGMLTDEQAEAVDTMWLASDLMQNVFKYACFMSMVSVSANTPETIKWWPPLGLIVFGVDGLITLLFSVEAIAKINRKGLVRTERSYFRDRWCLFDFTMLIFHWLSVSLQSYELAGRLFPHLNWTYQDWYGAIRSPRPLIMIRFIRSVIKFQLPRNRIQQILKRSSQQIQNVTIFFLFFMALYGILGVQFFGRMDYHCVLPGTNVSNVTISDLAIPDALCSEKGKGGYECPAHMECLKLDLRPKEEGYYGMFNDFAISVFTVYMAASQEGWVYVMYDCIDSMPAWWAFVYFITLIFFMAWLVKNVFIAVITETFAEIRVQFSQIWASREVVAEEDFRQILERSEDGWRLVTIDADKPEGRAPKACQDFLRSTTFQILMMLMVLSNAIVNATFVHHHDASDKPRKRIYYYIECGFTMLFNIECLFKVFCNGWRGYIRRGQHKFELVLCIGSTLNIIKPLYDLNIFTYFQVFRISRLIKASPMLEDFVYKIFGPGKKLGGLILFTVVLLIITSAISLQLFCYVPNLDKFRTFPEALMSMFQILTQEGWADTVVEVMRKTNDSAVPFVAVYFVAYHLFVTLIVLSLFVAVILDNLEMDEELKKIKQLKAREQTSSMRTKLPWRLRIFERFPNRPQMVRLKRIPNEFPLPKVRDSFTRQFADDDAEEGDETPCKNSFAGSKSLLERAYHVRKKQKQIRRLRQIGQLSSKSSVTFVVEESNKTRALLSDSTGAIPTLGRFGTNKYGRKDPTKSRHGPHASMKVKQMYEHLKENGDLVRPSDSAPKKDLKHGEIDIKAIEQKRQHAEITRNRIEVSEPLFNA
uniref:Ion transport domain-containing protein n=1 Tax=Plectus sambesii TaxID=2011161 RepID=A0A914VXL5_9BILA